MGLKIHNNFNIERLGEMKEVYQSVGWKKHTTEVIRQIFEASNVVTIVTIDGRVIGFARALSDGVFNAAIYDVVVHRDFQKRGIAKMIVKNILFQLADISCVHLISTTGNETFYRNLGFKNLKTGMARYLNRNLTEEYLK